MLARSRFSIKSMLIVTLNTFRGMQGSISCVYPKLGCLTFRFCELRQLLCALKQKELLQLIGCYGRMRMKKLRQEKSVL